MPVYPISFSIPESKIVDNVPAKTKQFGHIIPGVVSTYIFQDEPSYRQDYQTSVFGKTCKKGGWDCLRHYEILANGGIPWFDNLEKCPEMTMTHFPKEMVAKAMASETPEVYIPELLEYTRKHLTCRAMAQYVFDTVGCPNPKRVLFLSGDPRPDYLRCLTLIGMKQIVGTGCVESVHVPHIYDDYSNVTSLYGKGFTYSRVLSASAKPPMIHLDELKNGSFDLVVYGNLHRGLPYWDEVTNAYPPSKIILLCGEDCDSGSSFHTCSGVGFSTKEGVNVFIRELDCINVVQIGTNTGNDHVLKLCKSRHTSAIYLVEPFSIHNRAIQENYKDIPNVVIDNIAITPSAQHSIDLFYTEDDGPRDNPHKSYQVASIYPEHITKHDYARSNIKSIKVLAMTMNDFFNKYGLRTVDYLFMDIEGIDFEVLQSIDFSNINIKNLQIEHLHLDKEMLITFMRQRGYVARQGIDEHGFDTMFVKQSPDI